jgi:hypothetical protein
MQTIALSEPALDLLKRNLTGPQILVNDENREAYRELALAGLMIPLHTFAHGRESAYRMTEAGVNAASTLFPSPARVQRPHGSRVAWYWRRLSALRHGFRLRIPPVRAR